MRPTSLQAKPGAMKHHRPCCAHANGGMRHPSGAVTSARKRAFQPPPGAWNKRPVDHKKARSMKPCWARVSGGEPVTSYDSPACHQL